MEESNGVRQVFAERLRELREASGLTQQELAEKLNWSRGSISFYEKCQRCPDIEFLKAASTFFDVSADWLIGQSDVKSPHSDIQGVCSYTGLSEKSVFYLNYMSGKSKKAIQGIDYILSHHPVSLECLGTFTVVAVESAQRDDIWRPLSDFVPEDKMEEVNSYLSKWGGKLLSPYQLFDYYSMRAVNVLRKIIEEISGRSCGFSHVEEAIGIAAQDAAKRVIKEWSDSRGID